MIAQAANCQPYIKPVSVVEEPTDFILARIDSLTKDHLYTLTSKWLFNSVMKSTQLCFDYHSHTLSNTEGIRVSGILIYTRSYR